MKAETRGERVVVIVPESELDKLADEMDLMWSLIDEARFPLVYKFNWALSDITDVELEENAS